MVFHVFQSKGQLWSMCNSMFSIFSMFLRCFNVFQGIENNWKPLSGLKKGLLMRPPGCIYDQCVSICFSKLPPTVSQLVSNFQLFGNVSLIVGGLGPFLALPWPLVGPSWLHVGTPTVDPLFGSTFGPPSWPNLVPTWPLLGWYRAILGWSWPFLGLLLAHHGFIWGPQKWTHFWVPLLGLHLGLTWSQLRWYRLKI